MTLLRFKVSVSLNSHFSSKKMPFAQILEFVQRYLTYKQFFFVFFRMGKFIDLFSMRRECKREDETRARSLVSSPSSGLNDY